MRHGYWPYACLIVVAAMVASSDSDAGPSDSQPTTGTASAPATQPVRYLGLADDEETRFEAAELSGLVKVSRVKELAWKEYADLAEKSSQHEIHGHWLYLSVNEDRDVRFESPKEGQPASARVVVTRRYRVDVACEPAGLPARAKGKLTEGPPLAEMLAAIAIRLPEGWFIDGVRPGPSQGMTVHIGNRQFDQVSIELSLKDAERPIGEIVKRINSTKPTPTTSPATRPAEPLKMLDDPFSFREVIVGPIKWSEIHAYAKTSDSGPSRFVQYYRGSIVDRRTRRSEDFYMNMSNPFIFRNIITTDYTQWSDFSAMRAETQNLGVQVLAVKGFAGNTAAAYQLLVWLSTFEAPTTKPATAQTTRPASN